MWRKALIEPLALLGVVLSCALVTGCIRSHRAGVPLIQTIPLPGVEGRIDHFSVDLAGKRLFLCALGNNSVEVIDLQKGERVHSISGLGAPQGVAYATDAGRLYVANDKAGLCNIFDGKSYEPLGQIDLKFHPNYGYEDFIEGFRPQVNSNGQLVFELRPGIFQRICTDAGNQTERNFFLIIDEINRGDIPRIFGELITSLELDKRRQPLRLAISGNPFTVPSNVYIIGTMNTADRSIALLDTALRRRFGFIELMPDAATFGSASVGGAIPLATWLTALNDRIRTQLGRDSRNLQIGHAYFLINGMPVTDYAQFVRILAEDIVPLLEEYCYEDYDALARVLGSGMIDLAKQRIRDELFLPSRRDDLVQALLEPAAEALTSAEAVTDDSEELESEATEM